MSGDESLPSGDPLPVLILTDNPYFNKIGLVLYEYFTHFKTTVNNEFKQYEIWQVMLITVALTLMSEAILNFLIQEEPLLSRLKKGLFKAARASPIIGTIIKEKVDKTKAEMANDGPWVLPEGHTYLTRLPEKGLSDKDLMVVIDKYNSLNDVEWQKGRCSGTIYCAEEDKNEMLSEVYKKYCWSNPLHVDCFKDVRKMEAEVVTMVGKMFHHPGQASGSVTSGGTESILMSMKTHRDWAREVKGIDKPNIVVANSGHPAFDKAAAYFKIHIIAVPVDPVTFAVNPRDVAAAINSNTICIVGSVPQYPHGIMDDIVALGDIAVRHDVGLHVDACLGGFLIPFMEDAGFPLPLFDFRVPGVTAISIDTHKYGYTYKGSSVVLYRNVELFYHQITCTTEWPGGIYASPTMAGSRPGANIAVTWAAMMSFGRDGYVSATREVIRGARYLIAGLEKIEGVEVMGNPVVSCVGWTSKVFNIYNMSSDLTKKGWNLAVLQFPAGIHIALTRRHMSPGVIDELLSDIRESAAVQMLNPGAAASGAAAMYGMAAQIPDRSIVGDISREFWKLYYSTGQTELENGDLK